MMPDKEILYPQDVLDPEAIFYTSVQDFVDKNPRVAVTQYPDRKIKAWVKPLQTNYAVLIRSNGIPQFISGAIVGDFLPNINLPGIPIFLSYWNWANHRIPTEAYQEFIPGTKSLIRSSSIFSPKEASWLLEELKVYFGTVTYGVTINNIVYSNESRRQFTFSIGGKKWDMEYLMALRYSAGGVDCPGTWSDLDNPKFTPQKFINFATEIFPPPILVPTGYVASEIPGAPGSPAELCLRKIANQTPTLTDSQKIDFLYKRAQGLV